MLWMVRIRNGFQKKLVPWDSAAILRWTLPLSGQANGIGLFPARRQSSLQLHDVDPPVAEVVLVDCDGGYLVQVVLDRDLPSGQSPPSSFIFIIRNANLHETSSLKIGKAKGVQMGVQPSHGILNGDVKIPERVARGDLNPPPDRRHNTDEGNPNL